MIYAWAGDVGIFAAGIACLVYAYRHRARPAPARRRPSYRHRPGAIPRTVCVDGVTYPSDKLRALCAQPEENP